MISAKGNGAECFHPNLSPRETPESQFGSTKILWIASLTRISQCAPNAQITSEGRTHPRRLLVELGGLRASEPGNRVGRSLAIKPTKGG
jgi:hypothetical protein